MFKRFNDAYKSKAYQPSHAEFIEAEAENEYVDLQKAKRRYGGYLLMHSRLSKAVTYEI